MAAEKFEMLVKLMMMTTSDQDGEALVALRKANAIIAASGMNWEEFLRMKVKWPEPKEERTEEPKRKGSATFYPRSTNIDVMFEELDRNVKGSFREFIEDVQEFYEKRGGLTAAQHAAISKAYQNIWRR